MSSKLTISILLIILLFTTKYLYDKYYGYKIENFKDIFNPNNYQPVSQSEIDKVPSIFNNRKIEVHGRYTWGSEQSLFEPDIWISFNNDIIQINEPKITNNDGRPFTYWVTIYGRFNHDSTKNKYGYGHLGMGKSEIIADKIIYCQNANLK